MPPYDAKAVANYFLAKSNQLSSMKLQKLVYFAHGWHLALYDTPLIDECIQAWHYGPVIETLYHEFKRFGNDPIKKPAIIWNLEGTQFNPDMPEIQPEDTQTRQFLDRIWDVYGNFSGGQLANLTHAPETPWEEIRKQYPDSPIPKKTTIPDDRIKAYFIDKGNAA